MLGPGLLFVVSGPFGGRKRHAGRRAPEEFAASEILRVGDYAGASAGRGRGEALFLPEREEFERRRDSDGFLEWLEYNDNLYGTPRDFVERTLTEGYDLIMKPEVNGALKIKRSFPDAVLIFLAPDRFSNLRTRLLARRTETNEEIARRLEIAHEEFKFVRNFDYIVINAEERSDEAVRDLQAILQAERFRIHQI